MTIEKFFETLTFIIKVDNEVQFQSRLESVRETVTSLAAAPAQPQHQNALAVALSAFKNSADNLQGQISPAQFSAICEVSGAEFFSPSIYEKVQSSIEKNAMTPSVARDFVQDLAVRRAKFLATVSQTLQGLSELDITGTGLAPGSADFAFIVPRLLFGNHLDAFAKELTFINRLIQRLSESLTGVAEPVELAELSSSEPTIALAASAIVIERFAAIVNKFLDAWEKVLKIRQVRTELNDLGMKGKAVEELTDRITTIVDEVVEESIEVTLSDFTSNDGRKNELEAGLKQDLHRLFGQIERGLMIQFRAEPNSSGDEEIKKALESINQMSRTMHFPQVESEPVLLKSGEILEGELNPLSTKKTTTISKKTTKRTLRKETKQVNAMDS